MENITSDTPLNNAATVNNPTANYFDAIKNGITADPEILKYIASNPQIAQEELERLSETPVGTEVLKNPSAPINILEKAALSNDEEKRAAVAENPSTPLKHLRRLSKDKSDKVRSAAAKNPSIPKDIMKDLAKDSPKVRESLLENNMLTPDILDTLTSNASTSCDFNKKLMANPCIAASILAYNANNPDVCIRAGVAANPNTPKDIISKLADDSFPEVKSAAWKNPNIHQDKLSSLFLPDWTPQSIEHPTEQLRQYALENPSLDQDILDKAIFAAPERYADNVAKNPSASADTLNKIKNISKGKGGLKQFISDAMQLTTDAKKINNIKDEAAKYDNNPEIPLRKALNENFLKNVYNPYNLINDMRMLSKNHNQNTDLENKSHSNVTPASNIDMSIDKPISTTYSLELPEEIPESFSDILETIDDNENSTLSDAEKEAFATADRIVESLMEDILPHYSDNSVSEEDIGDRDNRFDTMEGNTNQLNNLLPTGDNDNNLQPTMGGSQPIGHNIPILGNPHQEWLFKNACEHIDELQSMF
ncbi:MAG: hypothetical protein IJD28_00560 [Deferribacterales bacterium]|nr:hypothetical protein [Deferribacterales bacterium]